MTARVHVACDSVACAVGADALAETLIQEAGRRGMPLEVVKQTVFSAMQMDWPEDRLHVYVLDDGRREEFRDFCDSMRKK